MAVIENWYGEPVAVRRSRGGVLTFERWEDNVRGTPPWPEALLGQVRGYVARRDHFAGADAAALAEHLDGRISKFQSVNSKDAVTYSWFGTLATAPADTRRAAVQWLYDRADIPAAAIVLRRDSLHGDPAFKHDERAFAVLGVAEHRPDLAKWHEPEGELRRVSVVWLTWDDLAECPEHPLADEFGRYIAWKRIHAA